MRLVLALLLGPITANSMAAETIELALPVDCRLGDECHIQQYVDHESGSDYQDFRCGTLTYDGHKGTDFRTATMSEMRQGVAVLAASDGTVTGVRDGMPDVAIGSTDAIDVTGRECGNGVVISHSDGWDTQYCHLREGSVSVRTGDKVVQGQQIGQIGISGMAAFPHVHFAVRRDGNVVDPFAPSFDGNCEAPNADALWKDAIPYTATGLLDAGFSTEVPQYEDVKKGLPEASTLTSEAPAIVVWAFYYGPQEGDVLTMEISGPDGFAFRHSYEVERTQAQAMRAAGRLAPEGKWTTGQYSAQFSYVRDDERQWATELTLTIVSP